MDRDQELALRKRIEEHVSLQAHHDVDSLYKFIDPDIRESRERDYDFEPARTISRIRELADLVQTAKVQNITIQAFTADGGPSRRNRPTAFVVVEVLYNGNERRRLRRTPWVLDHSQWYTRSLGR
jgi:hypothetical protein